MNRKIQPIHAKNFNLPLPISLKNAQKGSSKSKNPIPLIFLSFLE
jgi:hypothetical protein